MVRLQPPFHRGTCLCWRGLPHGPEAMEARVQGGGEMRGRQGGVTPGGGHVEAKEDHRESLR